ncbi:MAG: sulfurtransferase TusA family protein, partial [Clostridium sp.]
PPFSSAKDPVNMAGFLAENVLKGITDVITTDEFLAYDKTNTVLLDVRTDIEFENGHLEGAINIPVDELRERMNELDKNKEILEYCQVGIRGYIAARILSQNGFKVKNLTGGYKSALNSNIKPDKVRAFDGAKRQSVDPDTQVVKQSLDNETSNYDKAVDACGLCCPGPLIQVKAGIDDLNEGQILKVTASDPGFYEDIKAWCTKTNNELLEVRKEKGMVYAFIKKQ